MSAAFQRRANLTFGRRSGRQDTKIPRSAEEAQENETNLSSGFLKSPDEGGSFAWIGRD